MRTNSKREVTCVVLHLVATSTPHQSLIPQKSLNLNLHPHRLKPQPRNPNLRPYRMMDRTTPLLEIAHHRRSRGLVYRQVIASQTVYLAPAFTASGFQRELDVCESLVDLGVEVLGYPGGRGGQVSVGIPAA